MKPDAMEAEEPQMYFKEMDEPVARSHQQVEHAQPGAGAVVTPMWLPAVTGGAIGLLFAALNRAGLRRFWRAPAAPLNVVVTGSSRGIGKAIAREFLR